MPTGTFNNQRAQFAGFSYEVKTRLLTRPDGSSIKINGLAAVRLLRAFLEKPREGISKDELIAAVWPGEKTKTDNNLQELKARLVGLLNDEKVIEAVPGFGYLFNADVVWTDGGPVLPLEIFPGELWEAGMDHISSWIGCGTLDAVESILVKGSRKNTERPMIPVTLEQGRPILRMVVRHQTVVADAVRCWWAAVIPLGRIPLRVKWPEPDLRDYEWLIVECRFRPHKDSKPLSLGVRLEDASASSTSPSNHNSTGWYPEDLQLAESWSVLRLDLANLDWTELGWLDNTAPVSRQRMLQITIGQDYEFPPASGVLEIRRISFHPGS